MSDATSSSGRWRGQSPRTPGAPRGRGRGQGNPAAGPPYSGAAAGNRQGPPGRGPYTQRGPAQGQGRPGGAIFTQDRPNTVDARVKDGSDRAVVARLNSTDTPGPHGLPLRPDFGTKGREIALRVNHFPVNVKGKIFRYAAEITLTPSGKKVSRSVKRRVFALAEQTVHWQQAGLSGRVAHDGAEKLVASFQLPQPLTIGGAYHEEGEDADGGTEYALAITFVEQVDQELLNECLAGNPTDSQALAKVLSALNLVLAAYPSQTGTKIGRNDDDKKHPDQRIFFDSPPPKDIGGGLQVRKGYFLSVRPAHKQLTVNVNTCHAAFYKPQNFVDAMREYSQFMRGNTYGFGDGVRVITRHNQRVVMIRGVSKWNAREYKFKPKGYGEITIEQYYYQKYGTKLEHPNLPLLQGPTNDSLYPAELCLIYDHEAFKGELTDKRHAKAMLNEACKPPKVNAQDIVDHGLGKLGFRNDNPLLDSFGINVGTKMAVVPGRVLDMPGLSYSNASANIDDHASWNLRDVRFAVGAKLNRWAVLVVQDGGEDDFGGAGDRELRNVVGGFRRMCVKSGMQVAPLNDQAYAHVRLPRSVDSFRENAFEEIERTLKTLIARVKPELVLVMLSNEDRAIYNGLKRLCDVELDVASVCMQSNKVRGVQAQYFANVALKVNMKLGGINHKLDANSGTWLRSAPTMVMGMDVTHATGKADAKGMASIVAVVASKDQHFAQYPATLAVRGRGVEIERDQDDTTLVDMFASRLQLYKKHNGDKLPQRVILFRDGVSESQFVQVREYELEQMKKAFDRFDCHQPKLTIVVCGKRHHTRFYPTAQQDAAEDGNPLPGTVVDRGVTPAYEFDFFLQAHHSLKGTARPTHYFVVHDENGFNADGLQRVTLDLSYMFARATKAVSLVSPAYWADVACERGRCYLHRLLAARNKPDGADSGKDKDKKGKKRAGSEETVFDKAIKMWGKGVSGPNLRDTMFYL